MALFNYQDDEFSLYDALFKPLTGAFGPLTGSALAADVPFSAGGAISLATREADGLYVTTELIRDRDQLVSAEGLNYELFMFSSLAPATVREILGHVATVHLDMPLEEGGLADVGQLSFEPLPGAAVRFRKFSEEPAGFGLYQVSFA